MFYYMFCWGMVSLNITYISQGYFADIGAVYLNCERSNTVE